MLKVYFFLQPKETTPVPAKAPENVVKSERSVEKSKVKSEPSVPKKHSDKNRASEAKGLAIC